jgi:hypothetical protein
VSVRPTWCADAKPRCPHGHVLKLHGRPLDADVLLRCGWRSHPTGAPCGEWLYVLRCRWRSGETVWWVRAVTDEQRRALDAHEWTVLEKLDFLGETAPGVGLDLTGGLR